MLRSLQIRNYALIDSLDIEFPAGLVIITGQTGAGKSIIMGALSLALGAKADASVIGDASDKCVVEAVFDVKGDAKVAEALAEADIEVSDMLALRRIVSSSGRSRSFVNDEPVNAKVLSELSGMLMDIHSQHQTMMLRDKDFQLSILDSYAGCGILLEECADAWRSLSADRKRLSDLIEARRVLESDRDYYESRFRQLDEAALCEGELEELEAEQKVLANAGEIKASFLAVENLLEPEEGMSLDSMLKEASRYLEKTSSYVAEAGQLAQRLESLRIEAGDIVSEAERIEESIEVSEGRLEQVEERLSLLYSLMKKHGCSDVASLIAKREELSSKLYDTDSISFEIKNLESQVVVHQGHLDDVCARLHERRMEATGRFAADIQASLRSLEMENSVFDVVLSPCAQGPGGSDGITFLFSSSGRAPVDVAKCASGGEMSRIMLSLKAMMARYVSMPAMIFDEIDTGVSGSVADKMGKMICDMGNDMQVFAITHLPQVAAKGKAHYVVVKSVDAQGRAVTTIENVSGERRLMEIARMLSGSVITPQAKDNARTLLEG